MADAITSVALGAANEEFFLKPFQDDPTVMELGLDVKVQKRLLKLYFNSQLDKITKKKTGCGYDFVGGADITSKTLTPVEEAAAIEQCYEAFLNTYFAGDLPAGISRGELSPEIQDILLALFNNANKRDILSKLFLGDTLISDDYYSDFDGIYVKLAADAAIPNIGAITDGDIDVDHIEATMFSIYNNQTRLMRGMANAAKKFWVTGTVYDAWLRYIQLKTGNNIVIQRDGITMGVTNSNFYQGSEIVPVRIVDERLNADFVSGSPGVVENPHRIIYTIPDNHVLTFDKASFGDARAWYSNDDDKFYVAGSCLIAYEYKYSELQSIGGF